MNTREYFSQCFKAEKDKFLRVLKAVPADKTSYKPHERSTCAGDLVWLIASEWGDASELIDNGKVVRNADGTTATPPNGFGLRLVDEWPDYENLFRRRDKPK